MYDFFRVYVTSSLWIWCLIFTICAPEPPPPHPHIPANSDTSSLSTNALINLLFLFYLYWSICMCYCVMIWLASYKIQDFPSVHGHTFWSIPSKFSSLLPQTVTQRQYWASMRWPMTSQCIWVIVRFFLDIQQHAIRCSGYQQYLDTWNTPSPHWHAVLSHGHFSVRCHMFSS